MLRVIQFRAKPRLESKSVGSHSSSFFTPPLEEEVDWVIKCEPLSQSATVLVNPAIYQLSAFEQVGNFCASVNEVMCRVPVYLDHC